MKTQAALNLFPDAAEVIKDLKKQKAPMLVMQKGKPAAYLLDVDTFETLERGMLILEGIARREKAIQAGRTLAIPRREKE